MKNIFPLALLCCLAATLYAQPPAKYVLLETFTTAQCGFCPEGDLYADSLIIKYPNLITCAHHAGFGVDSMTAPGCATIANNFTTFAPAGLIDRGDYPIPVYTMPPYIAVSRQKWDSLCEVRLGDTAYCEIGITNTYNSSTRMLDAAVNVDFYYTPPPGDFRLHLFIIEDSVTGFGNGYDQTNYFNGQFGHPYYQAGDPIVGYVHRHVVRKIASQVWGNAGILPNNPIAGSSFTHTFNNVYIQPNWKEKDVDVIAFVSYYNIDTSKRTILNSSHKMLLDSSAVNDTTEVNEIRNSHEINIFPNPSNGNFSMSFTSSEKNNYNLEIQNVLGEIIYSETFSPLSSKRGAGGEVQFDLSKQSSGLYFILIKTEQGTAVQKLIIQK